MSDIIAGQTREEGAMVDRVQRSFILHWEKKTLARWVAKLPAWVKPDHLTLLGMLGAAGIVISYQLTSYSRHWLWGASLGLVVQWFGDSMDGTLARFRKIERPKYGFYIDHMTDMMATILIGLGMGLSAYMHLVTGLAIVVMYLLLGINVFVESQVTGLFRLGYSNFGPTEGRLIIITMNTLLWAGVNFSYQWGSHTVTLLDTVGVIGVSVMLVLFLVRFRQNLRDFAKGELNPHQKF